MLKIKDGNVFNYAAEGSVIAHGCNAQGKMGSGFAREIRTRFPRAYLHYRDAFYRGGLELGSYVLVHEKKFDIFNAIIQMYYGREKKVYVDYDAVKKSLTACGEYAGRYNKLVHFPLIGGGLAGGDKDKLISIYEEAFANVDATLYLLN